MYSMNKQAELTWIKRLSDGSTKQSKDGPWYEDMVDLKGCLLRCGDRAFELKMPGNYFLAEMKVMQQGAEPAFIGWSLTYNIPDNSEFSHIGIYYNSNGAIVFPIEEGSGLSKLTNHKYGIKSHTKIVFEISRMGGMNFRFY